MPLSAREDDDLAWTVEACLNPWHSRRPNSVDPLRGVRDEPEAVIAACEAAYAGPGFDRMLFSYCYRSRDPA